MKTALYDRHLSLGAKMVAFAGWEMPLQYQGVLAEHKAVRNSAALFDVSHMGRIKIEGRDAGRLLEYVSTNRIEERAPGEVIYTVWCKADGGSVDDLLIFKESETEFFAVANASNRETDLLHLKSQAKLQNFDAAIQDAYRGEGILALQGPAAASFLASLIPEVSALKPMQFISLEGGDFFVSRTGYTGSGGFELFGPEVKIIHWWDKIQGLGRPLGILPAGLGCRDTLRLEMGFALYGHELSQEIAPTESVSAWTVKMNKPSFLGKEALEALDKNPLKRQAFGVRLPGGVIAREGCPVFSEGEAIGVVTSGSFSPTLGEGIALILVQKELPPAKIVDIQIRQKLCPAEVVRLPFIKRSF